jgi:hypothetical protein
VKYVVSWFAINLRNIHGIRHGSSQEPLPYSIHFQHSLRLVTEWQQPSIIRNFQASTQALPFIDKATCSTQSNITYVAKTPQQPDHQHQHQQTCMTPSHMVAARQPHAEVFSLCDQYPEPC